MPDNALEFSGNTTSNLITDLIVNQLIEQGNATVNITNYNTTVSNSPLTTVALVE
jgi:hypothetical protein